MMIKTLSVWICLLLFPLATRADWFSPPSELRSDASESERATYVLRLAEFRARRYDNVDVLIWNSEGDRPDIVGVKIIVDYHLTQDFRYDDVSGGAPLETEITNPGVDFAALMFLAQDGSVRKRVDLAGKRKWVDFPDAKIHLVREFFASPPGGISVKAGERLRLMVYFEMPLLPTDRELPVLLLPQVFPRVPECKVVIRHPGLREIAVQSSGLVLVDESGKARRYRCRDGGAEPLFFILSGLSNYSQVAEQLRNLQAVALVDEDVDALRKIADAEGGGAIGIELIRRLHSYVASLPYVQRSRFQGLRPQSPDQTRLLGGKCDDKSLLLKELLRSKGIDSSVVYVAIGRTVLPTLPSSASFNHALLHVPAFDVYVDTNDPGDELGVPVDLAGFPYLDSSTGRTDFLPRRLGLSRPTENRSTKKD